jgi:hypothetical protein
MKPYPLSHVIVTAIFLSGCSTGSEQDLDGYVEVSAAPDAVITTESGLIGGLADWAIGPDGSIFLLDRQHRQIHVIDSTGRPLRTVGRPGQGPGELEQPASLYLSGDSVTVVDPGNGRLQGFTSDGGLASSQTILACASGPAPPAVGPDGILVRPTLGFDEALAIVCSMRGEELARLGELLAPGQAELDMTHMRQMRAQALEGVVPAVLLNTADAVVGSDGAVWLTLSAAAQIEKYRQTGEQLARVTVDEPEFDAVHKAWIERNEEMSGFAVAGLRYFLSVRAVQRDLWVLLNTAGQTGARLLVLGAGGSIKQRLEFIHVYDAGDFAVDEDRGWVYFYIPDTAEVVRVALDTRRPH